MTLARAVSERWPRAGERRRGRVVDALRQVEHAIALRVLERLPVGRVPAARDVRRIALELGERGPIGFVGVEDLTDGLAVFRLYRRMVRSAVVDRSEHTRARFFALAAHARRRAGRGRHLLFRRLLELQAWPTTTADEDAGALLLRNALRGRGSRALALAAAQTSRPALERIRANLGGLEDRGTLRRIVRRVGVKSAVAKLTALGWSAERLRRASEPKGNV